MKGWTPGGDEVTLTARQEECVLALIGRAPALLPERGRGWGWSTVLATAARYDQGYRQADGWLAAYGVAVCGGCRRTYQVREGEPAVLMCPSCRSGGQSPAPWIEGPGQAIAAAGRLRDAAAPRKQCKAVNSRGERDQCWAMPGSDYCRHHTPPSGAAEHAGQDSMIVGEHGPEIVSLPPGTGVTPSWASDPEGTDTDER